MFILPTENRIKGKFILIQLPRRIYDDQTKHEQMCRAIYVNICENIAHTENGKLHFLPDGTIFKKLTNKQAKKHKTKYHKKRTVPDTYLGCEIIQRPKGDNKESIFLYRDEHFIVFMNGKDSWTGYSDEGKVFSNEPTKKRAVKTMKHHIDYKKDAEC